MRFGFNFDSYNVIFEIYIGNKLVSRQNMQAPKEMLMLSFMQTVNDVANDNRPIKLKMIRQETIWDKFENKEKVFDNVVEFVNNVWDKDKV